MLFVGNEMDARWREDACNGRGAYFLTNAGSLIESELYGIRIYV
jgi:hypothetical protein